MEIRAWATRLLHGTTLEDKLAPAGELADELADDAPGGGVPVPDAPGRPVGAGFSAERAVFPGEHELHRPEARGRVLHFFANHELLAIELMALALLRFPEAPPAFRAGLVRIVGEEQAHLAGYLDRMGAVGVRFGDLPLNRYFWDALRGVADPLALVAGMSLTFEQANLDHAGWWAAAFRRADDPATAAALDRVLADEIGHVRHGVEWLDRWRGDRSRWDAWVAALPPPLTPARAKGPRFLRRARLAAGLDADTIERVAGFGASKGRPPVVHAFEPGVEEALVAAAPAPAAGGAPARTEGESPAARAVAADLGALPLWLCREDDLVLLPVPPTPEWRALVADVGGPVPELVPWDGGPLDAVLAGRRVGGFAPWARSPAFAAASAALGGPAWDERWRPAFSKAWAVRRFGEGDAAAPAVYADLAEIEARVAGEPGPLVAKAPLATAGRGNRRLPVGALGERDRAWLAGVLRAQGEVVVERWLDRVADLSVQLDVAADGGVRAHRYGRFLTEAGGRYLGAVLGRPLAGLPRDVLRFLDEARAGEALAAAAGSVGQALAGLGYSGPAGVDALVHRGADGSLALRPVVEVNPRVTMGRVAGALQRRLRGGRVGLWVQLTAPALRRRGVPDPAAWIAARCALHPPRVHGDPPLLDHGILPTTDPARATMVYTLLAVAPTLDEAVELLGGARLVGLP